MEYPVGVGQTEKIIETPHHFSYHQNYHFSDLFGKIQFLLNSERCKSENMIMRKFMQCLGKQK